MKKGVSFQNKFEDEGLNLREDAAVCMEKANDGDCNTVCCHSQLE